MYQSGEGFCLPKKKTKFSNDENGKQNIEWSFCYSHDSFYIL